MNYFWAFVTGGAICVVGQLFLDLTALTPARILTGYVVAGVVLSALGWYSPLAEFAGCGATVPLLGFGHLLAKGVRTALAEEGAIGILTGGLTAASPPALSAAWSVRWWAAATTRTEAELFLGRYSFFVYRPFLRRFAPSAWYTFPEKEMIVMRETLATILWEGWTALVLCAAAVFLPGSEALTYPAVLWPGLVLAAAVPAGWAFWALAEQPAPLPPEQLLEKQKPPYRVPDTEVLFVSRSLDLS